MVIWRSLQMSPTVHKNSYPSQLYFAVGVTCPGPQLMLNNTTLIGGYFHTLKEAMPVSVKLQVYIHYSWYQWCTTHVHNNVFHAGPLGQADWQLPREYKRCWVTYKRCWVLSWVDFYTSILPSIHPSIHPTIQPSIHPSIHPSIYLSIYLLSIYLS